MADQDPLPSCNSRGKTVNRDFPADFKRDRVWEDQHRVGFILHAELALHGNNMLTGDGDLSREYTSRD